MYVCVYVCVQLWLSLPVFLLRCLLLLSGPGTVKRNFAVRLRVVVVHRGLTAVSVVGVGVGGARLLAGRRAVVDFAHRVQTLPRHLQHGVDDRLGYGEVGARVVGGCAAVHAARLVAVAVAVCGAVDFAAAAAAVRRVVLGRGGACGGCLVAHVLEDPAD